MIDFTVAAQATAAAARVAVAAQITELKQKIAAAEAMTAQVLSARDARDTTGNCTVCLTVKATCVMMPCHHLCVCTDCEAKIVARSSGERQCVYCRERLADA
jgi:hypothetical protein